MTALIPIHPLPRPLSPASVLCVHIYSSVSWVLLGQRSTTKISANWASFFKGTLQTESYQTSLLFQCIIVIFFISSFEQSQLDHWCLSTWLMLHHVIFFVYILLLKFKVVYLFFCSSVAKIKCCHVTFLQILKFVLYVLYRHLYNSCHIMFILPVYKLTVISGSGGWCVDVSAFVSMKPLHFSTSGHFQTWSFLNPNKCFSCLNLIRPWAVLLQHTTENHT